MGLQSYVSRIPRQWRTPKTLLALFALELLIEIPTLALFGIASPDLYRTKLWKEGSIHGWNSNPNEIAYSYANYRPMKYPLPWSEFTTKYNVTIAILSIFLLLVKGIMYIMHVFYPFLSAVLHAILVALYAVSAHNQAGSDMSDPAHPQHGAPWYITKSCGPPVASNLKGYCQQTKAAFAVTILLCVLFFVYFLLSLYSLYPTRPFRTSSQFKTGDDEESSPIQRPWEMTEASSPTSGTAAGLKSPTSPRTKAFDKLTGKAPAKKTNKEIQLRHHISMGDETYVGPNDNR